MNPEEALEEFHWMTPLRELAAQSPPGPDIARVQNALRRRSRHRWTLGIAGTAAAGLTLLAWGILAGVHKPASPGAQMPVAAEIPVRPPGFSAAVPRGILAPGACALQMLGGGKQHDFSPAVPDGGVAMPNLTLSF
jgi:hypothetical protein